MQAAIDKRHSLALTTLTLAYQVRNLFRQTNALPVLDQAIQAFRLGLSALAPTTDRGDYVNDLAGTLWERYKRNGQTTDLDDAITLLQDACTRDTPPGHPLRAESLNNLAICLHDRYQAQNAPADLDEAIQTHEAALVLRSEGHPDRSSSLTNISLCLRDRYKERGVPDDLNAALTHSRAAVALRPEGHPLRPSCLSNLAIALQFKYKLHSIPEDLLESIHLLRTALACYPPHHPERPTVLYNLCLSLYDKFEQDGTIADLDEAIDLLGPFKDRGSLHHPIWFSYIDALANCLKKRAIHLGTLVDIDQAILLHLIAAHACPQNHSERSTFLNNLASSFERRSSVLGTLDDLDKAIENHHAALELRPSGHMYHSSSLQNLAYCYRRRYERRHMLDDLVKAIEFNQAALELLPEGHLRVISLDSLANSLLLRFSKHNDPADLTATINLSRTALTLCPPGNVLRSETLHLLASALQRQFKLTHASVDLEESFQLYTELAHDARPGVGVSAHDMTAATAWATSADEFDHPSALTAYQTALALLARHTAMLPAAIERYQIVLRYASTLAVDACAYCLRHGQPRMAVELLEQGRSVFWTQLARLGTPLDTLAGLGADAARLGGEFRRISARLRALSEYTPLDVLSPTPAETQLQSQKQTQMHQTTRGLLTELDDVIARIRTTVPGFTHFLLPPTFTDLQSAAGTAEKEDGSDGGPVIIMNASQRSCDALIILPERDRDPVHVPLDMSHMQVTALATRFRAVTGALKRYGVREMAIVLRELWTYAVEPVVDALDQLGYGAEGTRRRRVWWCPTSAFTFLPLHAAGAYRAGQPNFPDMYVPSYTPTLGALCRARREQAQEQQERARQQQVPGGDNEDRPSFAVIGASTPQDESPLPSVPAELALVAAHIRNHTDARVTVLLDADATVERARETLQRFAWVHLACHGLPALIRHVDDEDEDESGERRKSGHRVYDIAPVRKMAALPFDAAFALHDGRLTLHTLVQSTHNDDNNSSNNNDGTVASPPPPRVRPTFAFLSACRTTVGDARAPDEAIHLAGAMHLAAGFRGVVGTILPVDDGVAGQVVSAFYARLLDGGGGLDCTRAAEALSGALQALRGEIPFDQRIVFIHIGI